MRRVVDVIHHPDGAKTYIFNDGSRELHLSPIEIEGQVPRQEEGISEPRSVQRPYEPERATHRPRSGRVDPPAERSTSASLRERLETAERNLQAVRAEQRASRRRETEQRRARLFASDLIDQEHRQPLGIDFGSPTIPRPRKISTERATVIRFAVTLGTVHGRLQAMATRGGPRRIPDPDANPLAAGFGGRRIPMVLTPLGRAIEAGLIAETSGGSLVVPSLRGFNRDIAELDIEYPGFIEAHDAAMERFRREASLEQLQEDLLANALLAVELIIWFGPAVARAAGRVLRWSRDIHAAWLSRRGYGTVVSASEVPEGAIDVTRRASSRSFAGEQGTALARRSSTSQSRGIESASRRSPPPRETGSTVARRVPPPRELAPGEAPAAPRAPITGTSLALREPPVRLWEMSTGLNRHQVDAAGRILGRRLNQGEMEDLFGRLWRGVADPRDVANLSRFVDEGRITVTRIVAREAFDAHRRRFWAAVCANAAATAALERAGFQFRPGRGTAPFVRMRTLNGEVREVTMDVDHLRELNSHPHMAVLARNLRLALQAENRTMLNQLHRMSPFLRSPRRAVLRSTGAPSPDDFLDPEDLEFDRIP